jgi:hypothetical protein
MELYTKELDAFHTEWSGNRQILSDAIGKLQGCLIGNNEIVDEGYFVVFARKLLDQYNGGDLSIYLKDLVLSFKYFMGVLTKGNEMLFTAVWEVNDHDPIIDRYRQALAEVGNSMVRNLEAVDTFWGQVDIMEKEIEVWASGDLLSGSSCSTEGSSSPYAWPRWTPSGSCCSNPESSCRQLGSFGRMYNKAIETLPNDWCPRSTIGQVCQLKLYTCGPRFCPFWYWNCRAPTRW